jgi:hypothetical protein
MPIDMSTEATTRVDDQKRQKQEEADFECTLEFRNHEGRHQYPQRQVLALGRFGFFGHVGEKFEILVTHILLHECAQGLRPAFKRLLGGYLFATSGLIPVSQAPCNAAPITDAVKKRANDTITALGGAVAVPSAVRSSDGNHDPRK